MKLPLTRALRHQFLRTLESIETGSLTLTTPEGETHHFGTSSPEAEVHIHDWAVLSALLTRGDVGLGEAYVAGHWSSPSVEAVLPTGVVELSQSVPVRRSQPVPPAALPASGSGAAGQFPARAARNIKSHYDVGNEFYQLWLDPSMTYSSALFTPGETDMLRAQNAKMDRILSRLGSGERVLEVGCGWGGFAERAAETGREVTGITISPSQKGYADARLDGRADIRLQDYRETEGTFDNIVSIEMIEAVGERYWPVYFGMLKDRLATGGKAVVQAITVPDHLFASYRSRSDFIRQYVFPGGMLLSPSAIETAAQKAGLRVAESFSFGDSYARTCRMWSEGLQAQGKRIDALGYDQGFRRSWHYYLESCAAVFQTGDANVMQVQLVHAD